MVQAGARVSGAETRLPTMSCLENMRLSALQEGAVLDERSPLLVAAGAGSGKTSLLVAYFVRALVDKGVPPERLVAVTFTRKAAAELSGRIRDSLEGLGRTDLARSLGAANIGTIHSLCRRLIRERPLEAGVDPACSVLEAESAWLVKDQISRTVWDRVVEETDEDGLEALASGGDGLRKEVVPLYDRLRGLGWERPQVPIPASTSAPEARSGLLRSLGEALTAGAEVSRPSTTLQNDLGRLQACSLRLEDGEATVSCVAELALTQSFFPSRKTSSLEPYFEPVRAALTRYRTTLAEERLRPVVRVMNQLLERFHESYQAHKEEKGLLDFADLELRARHLVLAAGSSLPAMPGSWVLIDEFQDTNEMQCSILEGLGASRLVMVGDERQSIYRFRGADVDVFRRRRSRLETDGPGAPTGGLRRLDINYRSRPEILAFINGLFGHDSFFGTWFVPLRSPEPSGEATTESVAGLDALTAPVEVLVVSRAEDAEQSGPNAAIQRAEARVIAARARRLVDEEGLAQRDIVVLLPAQTHVNIYQQELVDNGLAVYIVRGQGYYSQEEVVDVTCLLRLLVNPHDDLALIAVLRSPLACVSDDALYLLGRESRRKRDSLWEVVARPDPDGLAADDRLRLAAFVERFAALRRRVGRPGLPRLIDDAVTGCDYDVCVLGSADGRRRFANLRKLMRLAGEYEALEGPDLAGFVGLLQSMGDLADREGSAPTLAEGEDVVRVMTVHQAKGLEFPVVVLAGLGSDVPRGPNGEFVVGDDGRVGVFLRGSQRATYETQDLCWGPAAEIVAEERGKEQEEDVRLLYVAMTRAKQKLVLVGARPSNDSLTGCRIGRIVTALGLAAFPEEGTTLPLESVHAVVAGIPPPHADEGRPRRRDALVVPCPGEEPGPAPRLLDFVPGRDRPQRVSFSALAAYERCPRRYYLERVLGLGIAEQPGKRETEEESSPGETHLLLDNEELDAGRDVGLLVHALLERLPADDGKPSEAAARALAEDWLLQTEVGLSPGGVERAVNLAFAFWESPSATAGRGPSAMREVPFLFTQDGVVVSGVMDLLKKEERLWHIVDYKTNALNERSPAEVASTYDLQASVYCLAALRAGAPAVQDFVFLEQPRIPVTVTHRPDSIPLLERAIEEALEGFTDSRFPERPCAQCGLCPVADVCEVMA